MTTTPPEPINADFVYADIVIDEASHAQPKYVVIEFETVNGLVVMRLPVDGALELASSLMRLPLEHHTHHQA
jgi:hypothetical protein